MNEKATNWVLLVVCFVLLAGTVVSARLAGYYHGKYTSLKATVDAAGNGGLVDLVQQHDGTIQSLQDNNRELRSELESARELTGELRDRHGRAVEIAIRSNERFTEFETAMDSGGDIIENLISREQRIDSLVNGLREDNRRLTDALGVRP